MPSPASPGTNQFQCKACGRYFNTEGEFRAHEAECEAAKQSQPHREAPAADNMHGDDREWKSTP